MNAGIELRELGQLNTQQLHDLRMLEIPDQQVEFGGSFSQSVDECLGGPPASIRGLGILLNGLPIGLVVLKRPPLSPEWAADDMVTLHGLKIDARWQGQGHGKAGFTGAVALCAAVWPEAKRLALTVDADNHVALALYKGFGMTDSGPVIQGRIGLEHRLEIALD